MGTWGDLNATGGVGKGKISTARQVRQDICDEKIGRRPQVRKYFWRLAVDCAKGRTIVGGKSCLIQGISSQSG